MASYQTVNGRSFLVSYRTDLCMRIQSCIKGSVKRRVEILTLYCFASLQKLSHSDFHANGACRVLPKHLVQCQAFPIVLGIGLSFGNLALIGFLSTNVVLSPCGSRLSSHDRTIEARRKYSSTTKMTFFASSLPSPPLMHDLTARKAFSTPISIHHFDFGFSLIWSSYFSSRSVGKNCKRGRQVEKQKKQDAKEREAERVTIGRAETIA